MAKLIVNGQQILGDCALDADLSQLKKIYGDDAEISVMPDASEKAAMDAATRKQAQLAGVEFTDPVSGKTVMASATGDDQAGLSAIFLKHSLAQMAGKALPDVHFRFANGNVLTLNADNIDALDAVWTPFRLSFFPPPKEG